MASPTVQAALYTLIPAGATVAGGGLAAWRPPGPKTTSAIQHAAAGVVFAAVALEIIPDVRSHSTWATIIGFSSGIVAMLGLRSLSGRLGAEAAEGGLGRALASNAALLASAGLLLTVALDMLVDGLVLGAGFAAGARQGVLLTVALTLELLFLGLSTAGALANAGATARVVTTVTASMALLAVIGATVGAAILGGVSATTLAGVLAFGAVALMYLVTEELLVEAHEVEETSWAVALFFVGFLVFLVIAEITE